MHNPAMQRESLTALSPKLSLDVNGNGSCSFVIGPGNHCFDLINRRKSIVTVHQDGREIWRGRVMDDETDTYKQKNVYAEGVRACLNDSLAAPYTFTGTAQELLSKLIDEHNDQVEEDKRFTLGRVTCARAGETISGLKNVAYWNTYQEIDEKILSVYGGYLKPRHEGGVQYLDWLQEYDGSSAQQIRFGVNLLDIRDKNDAGEMFTVLRPLGASEIGEDGEYAPPVSIASVNDGLDYIEDDEAVKKYGRIWKAYTWAHITDPAELLKKAQEYLKTGAELRTLTLKAIDMHLMDGSVDGISIGQKVKIRVLPHDIDIELPCSKMEIDLVSPENTIYTFGEAPRALSDNVITAEEEIGEMTGGFGGGGGRSVKEENTGIIRWAQLKVNEQQANINMLAYEANQLENRLSYCEVDIDGINANIWLMATRDEVDALGKRVTQAEIEIDGANAEINLRAKQSVVDDLGERLSAAELDVDGLNAQISLKAGRDEMTELTKRVSAAEVEIDGANAQIALKAGRDEVTGLSERVTAAELDIDGLDAQIALKASQKSVDSLSERITAAEVEIDGANAQIALKASQKSVDSLGERLSAAEVEIDGANAQIVLKASRSDVDALSGRVSAAELEIDGANSEIRLKADKTYVENLIAQRISAAVAEISANFSDSVSTDYLVASTYATFNCPINYQGDALKKTKVPIVTSFTQASGESAPVTEITLILTADGADTAQMAAAGETMTF
jgi:predicted  nucleic acid-binding Zn-ribbon protein